jgi:hypothetical protein
MTNDTLEDVVDSVEVCTLPAAGALDTLSVVAAPCGFVTKF